VAGVDNTGQRHATTCTKKRRNDGIGGGKLACETSDRCPSGTDRRGKPFRYLLDPWSFDRGLLGCGRRKVAAVGAGFLSALGFFTSRLPLLRPLANTVLPFTELWQRPIYGVCLSAVLVIALPPAVRSWPTPEVV
jgi:hypothetical protein